MEVFYQVAGQIVLLLYAITKTKTTGGLEAAFTQKTFSGIPLDPVIVLLLSIMITLKSCVTLLLKTVKVEKQFVPFTSTIVILLWGLFSTIRRILSMVCIFIPSLGLLNILYHHQMEQKPFSIWQKHGKSQKDNVVLYGLTETVTWGELDRWSYSSTGSDPVPPHYSEYTGLTLKESFNLLVYLTGMNFLFLLITKLLTSRAFCQRGDYLNKFLHILLNLNLAFPFEDWDQGKFTVKEYKGRHRRTNIEMAWSLSVNIIFSLIKLLPLMYTGKKDYFTTKPLIHFFKMIL